MDAALPLFTESVEAEMKKVAEEIMGLENSVKSFNALNARLHTAKTRGGVHPADFAESQQLEKVTAITALVLPILFSTSFVSFSLSLSLLFSLPFSSFSITRCSLR